MIVVLLALTGVLAMSSVALAAEPGPVAMASQTMAVVAGEPSDEEIEGLLFMVEEEKLARDVYLGLYDEWGAVIFENIASSEQSHMDALTVLIERYGLESPVLDEQGQFNDPELQALYDELMETGSQSLADALKVGAAIEEIDILDLQDYLAETELADIQRVYENLLKGSSNHLRAFVRTLENQTGESYEQQYMSPEAYDEIMSASNGQGGRRGGGNSGAGNNTGGRGRGR